MNNMYIYNAFIYGIYWCIHLGYTDAFIYGYTALHLGVYTDALYLGVYTDVFIYGV